MRTFILNAILLLFVGLLCIQCNNKGSNENEQEAIRTFEDAINLSDSLLHADYIFLHDNYGRFIIVPKRQEDFEIPVDLKVYDSSAHLENCVKIQLFDYADSIYEGRGKDEIFVSSSGGSGCYGHLSRINLSTQEVENEIDLGSMTGGIYRIPTGFKVYHGLSVVQYEPYDTKYIEEIDFYGNLIKGYSY